MNIGARIGCWLRGDYVADSALCYLDGEWNIAKGQHSSTATQWIDLTGNGYNATRSDTNVTFQSNYVSIPETGRNLEIPKGCYSSTESTIEIVCEPADLYDSTSGRLFAAYEDSNYRFSVMFRPDGWFGIQCGYVGKTFASDQVYYGATYGKKYYVCLAKSSTSDIALYVNGVKTSMAGFFDGIYIPTNKMTLFNTNVKTRSTTGKIFRFMSHSRRLKDNEIAANYAIDKARFGLT